LPISDSLSATTTCIEDRSLSTANDDELDEPVEELEEPVEAPPSAEAPVPVEELLLELRELDAFVVPLADAVSPTSPDKLTIVPFCGAYSFVSWTACSSLCTVRRSLFTAAIAEARFASRVAALTVDFAEDEPPDCCSPSLLAPADGVVLAEDLRVDVLV
jgi:hypothetical protein